MERKNSDEQREKTNGKVKTGKGKLGEAYPVERSGGPGIISRSSTAKINTRGKRRHMT